MTLLAVENLHAYYGDAHILQGVSLTVGAGEVVTLIGRNGAGKTTTLKSIMGLVSPRGGRITFDGRELTKLPTHEVARAGIAYVPEERRIGILGEINRRGTTILLVEQMLEVALALSHRLYVMDQGRIQFEGTPAALRADPEIQQRFLGV